MPLKLPKPSAPARKVLLIAGWMLLIYCVVLAEIKYAANHPITQQTTVQ